MRERTGGRREGEAEGERGEMGGRRGGGWEGRDEEKNGGLN